MSYEWDIRLVIYLFVVSPLFEDIFSFFFPEQVPTLACSCNPEILGNQYPNHDANMRDIRFRFTILLTKILVN